MNNNFCVNEGNDGASAIRSLQEMELWDKQEVGCWLMTIGGFCVPMVEKCYNNNIDGHLLVKLLKNEATLVHEYGLSKHQASIFVDYLMADKHEVKKEVNLCNKVELARCDSKREGVTSIVQEWTYEHVCLWLLATGGQKLSMLDAFYRNQVNGSHLLELTPDQLKAWGYPMCDVDSLFKRRDEIKDNGFCFKESFNKLFVRRRRIVSAREEPERDMDSVSLDGSDTSSLCEADSFEPYVSNESLDPCHYIDESVSFDEKRIETEDGIVVVGDIRRDESDSEDIDDAIAYVGDLRGDESLTAAENIEKDVDIIEPNQRVVYDQKFDDLDEANETDGVYIAIGDGLIKDKETGGEIISLSPISIPHIDERNQRILKIVRQAEDAKTSDGVARNSSQSNVGEETKGEFISLSPVSVPHIDNKNQRIMKIVREAEHAQTPDGEIQEFSQSEKQNAIHTAQKIPSAFKNRTQLQPGECTDLQKQNSSVQKIPQAYRSQKLERIPLKKETEQVEVRSVQIRTQSELDDPLPGEKPFREDLSFQELEIQEQAVRNRKQTSQQIQIQNPLPGYQIQSTENEEYAAAKDFKAFRNQKQIQTQNPLPEEDLQLKEREESIAIQHVQDPSVVQEQTKTVQISQRIVRSRSGSIQQQKIEHQDQSCELQQHQTSDENRIVPFSQKMIRSRNRTEKAQPQNPAQNISATFSEERDQDTKIRKINADEFQKQQDRIPPDANRDVQVSQQFFGSINRTEELQNQNMHISQAQFCQDEPQNQDQIALDAVKDFKRNITDQDYSQQFLKNENNSAQIIEAQILEKQVDVDIANAQSQFMQIQSQHQETTSLKQYDVKMMQTNRQQSQTQSSAHVHRINVQTSEEQNQFGSQNGHQMIDEFGDSLNFIFGQQDGRKDKMFMIEVVEDQLQRSQPYRIEDFHKASQFHIQQSEQDFWIRDTLTAKQFERSDQFFTVSRQKFPLQEFMQNLMQNMHSQEEEDLIFMQSQYFTATWLLLACAAATLNLEECSKTPGGFGSCKAEMVQFMQTKTVQTAALC